MRKYFILGDLKVTKFVKAMIASFLLALMSEFLGHLKAPGMTRRLYKNACTKNRVLQLNAYVTRSEALMGLVTILDDISKPPTNHTNSFQHTTRSKFLKLNESTIQTKLEIDLVR